VYLQPSLALRLQEQIDQRFTLLLINKKSYERVRRARARFERGSGRRTREMKGPMGNPWCTGCKGVCKNTLTACAAEAQQK
jgi:hypothetical protein